MACTEPQCLYSTAIPLLPLWTVRPVQSLSSCTSVHFTFLLLNVGYVIVIFKGDVLSPFLFNVAVPVPLRMSKQSRGTETE